jgi:hypothetical protein
MQDIIRLSTKQFTLKIRNHRLDGINKARVKKYIVFMPFHFVTFYRGIDKSREDPQVTCVPNAAQNSQFHRKT